MTAGVRPTLTPQPRRPIAGQGNDVLLDAIALALPYTRLIEVKLVGNLFLHDLITPVIVLFLIARGAPLRPLRPFLILLGIWLGGAVFTDLYRHTPFTDYSRGWSKIVLFGLNAVLVWLLTQGQGRRLAIYSFSTGLALCASAIITPQELDTTEPWKFGFGYGIALALAAVAMSSGINRRLSNNVGSWVLGAVAIISLVQNSRSLFAITALAAAYSPVAKWISARPRWSRRLSPASFMAIILAGLFAGQALVAGYGVLAQDGTLGRDAQAKFLAQTKGDVNFIQGGRIESLVSLEAIADSPIIGHGSWAKDPYYLELLMVKLREAGLPPLGDFYDVGVKTEFVIPTHSFLFGTWVENGIFAVPIWIYAFLLAFRSLYSIIKVHAQSSALLSLVAFAMMWDIFFSPFAADTRIIKGLEICILIAAVNALKSLRPVPTPAAAPNAFAGAPKPRSRRAAATSPI